MCSVTAANSSEARWVMRPAWRPIGPSTRYEMRGSSRGVHAMAEAVGRDPGAFVHVRKRIPIAAGLGGGSSDAGAVLRALATIWQRPDVDLVAIAASLGSDVPFFASGARVALVSGRGERVEALSSLAPTHFVIVRLGARLATPDVFAALRNEDRQADGAV